MTGVLEQVLPPGVAWAEATSDDAPAPLFAAEAAHVVRAVDARRREFATVRACARRALASLGVPAAPILPDPSGAPIWPEGVVGSMTHCAGYRAAAVARASEIRALGIDAEPHEPLPDDVLDLIASPDERARLGDLTADVHGDRLLFSAKEAAFKAWFPLSRARLDFTAAAVTLHPAHTFTARLGDGELLRGRWAVAGGLVLTAVALPR